VSSNDLEPRNPLFCVISPNSIVLQADYVRVVEDRLIISAKYRLPVTFGKNWPTLQRGLSAIVELGLHVKRVNAQTAGVYRHW